MSTQNSTYPPPLVCRKKVFDFQMRPFIMGVLNVTPDSFSDGGTYYDHTRAVAHGIRLAQDGADIIDVGGESTRPGADPVSAEEELKRVLPVIQELSRSVDIPLSIDTTKAEVARRALAVGAEIVNDVSALGFDTDMARVVVDYDVPVVLMHMRGTPVNMQSNTHYVSLMEEIRDYLTQRICVALDAGIAEDKLVVDPGIGFGKSVAHHNFTILKHLGVLQSLGRPVLVGPSRKAFIGALLNKPAVQRDEGTAAAVAIAVYNGAHIVRVHNVRMTSMAMRVADAVCKAP